MDMDEPIKHVLIVGGGITGLSAAFYVKQYAEQTDTRIRMTIVEKERRCGGKIATLRKDGFVMEAGPDSFLTRKQPIMDLTRELGLERELVGTNPQAKKTYILRDGTLHRMPAGFVLGVPTRLGAMMKTRLLSPMGKARAAMDYVLPRRRDESDEALGEFLIRRLGSELHDWIAEPILAGIHAGNTKTLSVQATFPQFVDVERNDRSLIRGMRKNLRQTAAPAAAKGSVFMSYRGGLSTLIETLLDRLDGVDIIYGDEVTSLERQADDRYRAATTNGRELMADAVILALPAYGLSSLLPQLPSVVRFGEMPYVSVANVLLGYRRTHIAGPLDGSGFVVPRKEGRFITACTWTSSKWGHTAPDDHVLIRCYVGRAGDERWMQMTESELVERVIKDVRETSNIDAQPVFVHVNLHVRAMPQYEVGHLERIEQMRAELSKRLPGVVATGSAFHGVGIPDCIRQGKEAAKAVIDVL